MKEFRANDSKVGGPVAGLTMLLLTTTGEKNGKQTVSPLVGTVDGERLIVYASAAGRPHNLAWYHNVVANPEMTVEFGRERFPAGAMVTSGAECDRLWADQVAKVPSFGDYECNTTRVIPVVVLERISRGRTSDPFAR